MRPDLEEEFRDEKARCGEESILRGFRLRNGNVVHLVVDPEGFILGRAVGGKAGVVTVYEFDDADIVASVKGRRVLSGWWWWPWSVYRVEYVETHRVP